MLENLTGRDLAYLAHRAAIDEAAEIQQRMALRSLVRPMHGAKALPLRPIMRNLGRTGTTFASASSLSEEEAGNDETRLARLYVIIENLEALFARMHGVSDAEFAEWAADHLAGRHEPKGRF